MTARLASDPSLPIAMTRDMWRSRTVLFAYLELSAIAASLAFLALAAYRSEKVNWFVVLCLSVIYLMIYVVVP